MISTSKNLIMNARKFDHLFVCAAIICMLSGCSNNGSSDQEFLPVFASATGDLTQGPLTVTAEDNDGGRILSSVTIAQGTTFSDGNGNALDNTKVTLDTGFFDGSEASKQSYPANTTRIDPALVERLNARYGLNLNPNLPIQLDLDSFVLFDVSAPLSNSLTQQEKLFQGDAANCNRPVECDLDLIYWSMDPEPTCPFKGNIEVQNKVSSDDLVCEIAFSDGSKQEATGTYDCASNEYTVNVLIPKGKEMRGGISCPTDKTVNLVTGASD